MSVVLFSIPQLVFLATVIILAHLWPRRRPSTTRTSHQHDCASEGPSPGTGEVSEDLTDDKANQIADDYSVSSKSGAV
jgi:hypothetical protein